MLSIWHYWKRFKEENKRREKELGKGATRELNKEEEQKTKVEERVKKAAKKEAYRSEERDWQQKQQKRQVYGQENKIHCFSGPPASVQLPPGFYFILNVQARDRPRPGALCMAPNIRIRLCACMCAL